MLNPQKKVDEPSIIERLHEIIRNMSENQQKMLLSILQDIDSIDRRKHPRKQGQLNVKYEDETGTYNGHIQNISIGGVCIETECPVSVGHIFELTILPPDKMKPMKITGEVVWSRADGFGIRFKKKHESREYVDK
ncbi:MAG: PilZ domain-containing protein [Desulfobacterales bacterium]|nr:PilZ domain-containing protein [Desulfobacterales bacterium]